MSTIDNKIVQMAFENTSFERKLEETLRSLDQLKKKLDFTNSTKNIGELDRAAKSFDLSGMADKVGHVSRSFLALTTVAVTALATITQKAVSSGLQMVKSLSVDPILDGYKEYETNLNSIQTILANTSSKGSTLGDVNTALKTLNDYSDKTIYNFSQMARNIGTFTAAGVDLNTSVTAIKGIANLAALSGSNADQASSAMYQLSQALATGTVKLMDWNSVVNAGMGGEVFQKALFNTGKQLGTIKDVPIGQTFEQWTAAGNSFRGSLESGWLTSKVLTQTLQGFTGDLTAAQLKAQGYTDQQAQEIIKMGKIAQDAATKVKTVSQLFGTLKEAVGSGWGQTFQLIFGDFEQSKTLFTDLSNSIGGFIKKSADSRNQLIGLWNYLGGRTILIQALKDAFAGFATIVKPIKEAFQNIFPPVTAVRLLELTKRFAEFAKNIKIGAETARKIKDIFGGLFSVFKIGIEVVKELGKFLGDMAQKVFGDGSGILDFFAKIGEKITFLKFQLVDGGGIAKFFDVLREAVAKPQEALQKLKDLISGLFSGFTGGKVPGFEGVSNVLDRVTERFKNVQTLAKKVVGVFEWLGERIKSVLNVLDTIWQGIKDWFSQLGDKLAAALSPGEFNQVLDAINVGLLGGIALLIAKWLKGGISIDLSGGMFDSISKMFDQLTGTLKAMQTNLKADTLKSIAISIGILTLSLLALSLIDSAALTKALTATAVGFGQLVAAMALLDKLGTDFKGAAQLSAIGAGMILLSSALVILSVAVKVLSTMSWEELAKGMSAVTLLLGEMVGISHLLGDNALSMVAAGAGMVAISSGLVILSFAVKSFADLSWGEMLKGLAGVALGLAAITLAMNLMPASSILTGPAFIAVAIGLTILAGAVALFAHFKWGEIGKGIGAIAIALVAIAFGMSLMPLSLPLTAAGLILVSIALEAMVGVIASMGKMKIGTLAKGIGSLAAVLVILAVGLTAMSGTIGGSIALTIAAVGLLAIARVIKEIGALQLGQIIKGLIGIAAVLAVLGLAAFLLQPLIPALLGLGLALTLVGAGFALFGVGAALVADSLATIAKLGGKGLKAFISLLDALISKIPEFIKSVVKGFIDSAQVIIDGAGPLVKAIGVLVDHILDTLIKLIPKAVKLIEKLIDALVKILHEKGPALIEAGLELLTNLLKGIESHIGEITETVAQIIINFLDALASHAQELVEAGLNLVVKILEGIAGGITNVVTAGFDVITALIRGVIDNIGLIATMAGELITAFVKAIADLATTIVKAGTDALVSFLQGLTNNVTYVITAVGQMIAQVIKAIGDLAKTIAKAGTDALVSFLGGITDNLSKVGTAVTTLITTFITEVGNNALRVVVAGGNAVITFLKGVALMFPLVLIQGAKTIVAFIDGVLSAGLVIADGAAKAIIKFMNALADSIRDNSKGFRDAGVNIATAILDGVTLGLSSKAAAVAKKSFDVAKAVALPWTTVFKINSPSKLMIGVGHSIMEGLSMGLDRYTPMGVSASEGAANATAKAMLSTFSQIQDVTSSMGEFNPTITPVLDLSSLQNDAKTIPGLFTSTKLSTQLSLTQAQQVSALNQPPAPTEPVAPAPPQATEIKFEQTINAPTELSANEIYRQTRSQLALAREELKIP